VEPATPGVPRRLLGASHLPERWVELGVLDLLWERLIEECGELGGVDFEWQAADGAMGKARFGGTSWAPIPPIEPKTASNAPSWSRLTEDRFR